MKIYKNKMLSIFYRSSIYNTYYESIKILNNVYFTIFKPDCFKVPLNVDSINFGTRAPSEQTQMVLIKGKLGQFKVIWPCGGVGMFLRKTQPSELGAVSDVIHSGRLWLPLTLHDDKRFWVFKKEKKHFIFCLKTKQLEDRCFLSPKEQKSSYRDWPVLRFCLKRGVIFNAEDHRSSIKTQTKQTVEDKRENQFIKLTSEAQPWANRLMICWSNKINKINEVNEVNGPFSGHTEENKMVSKEGHNFENTIVSRSEDKIGVWASRGRPTLKGPTKQLKKIITGIIQGYTKNLELRGIGYQGKIIEQEFVAVKNDNIIHCDSKRVAGLNWGQLENKINEIRSALSKFSKSIRYKGAESAFIKKSRRPNNEMESRSAQFNGGIFTKFLLNGALVRKFLVLNLGWSHQIKYLIPEREVSASILQVGTISLFGISSFKVNQIAAEIYKFKKPEPYKGKGIRYDGEKFFEKTKKG